jgi:hypothetical protein
MPFIYILVALVVAAAIILFLRTRSRGAGQEEADARGPATVVRVDTQISLPRTEAKPKDFDPGATQVYMRPDQDAAPAPARKLDGAAPVSVANARLVGMSGSLKGHSFPIPAKGITVGRNANSDIVLSDTRISGRHAWIGIVDGKAMLRDLDSTNGTFLNTQTRSSVSEAELRSGDMISFGGHQGDQFRIVLE